MKIYQQQLSIRTNGRKTYDITSMIQRAALQSGIAEGICSLTVMHTSCSIFVSENADPSVQSDLCEYINRLVPENEPYYTHIYEGDDDMPAHIKSALLPTSLTVPIVHGEVLMGTWQAIYLWEHRYFHHTRYVHATVMGE